MMPFEKQVTNPILCRFFIWKWNLSATIMDHLGFAKLLYIDKAT